MLNIKYCPLLSATAEDNLVTCQGELCAWYVPPIFAPNGKAVNVGRCAVQGLGALPELVQGVRGL